MCSQEGRYSRLSADTRRLPERTCLTACSVAGVAAGGIGRRGGIYAEGSSK